MLSPPKKKTEMFAKEQKGEELSPTLEKSLTALRTVTQCLKKFERLLEREFLLLRHLLGRTFPFDLSSLAKVEMI